MRWKRDTFVECVEALRRLREKPMSDDEIGKSPYARVLFAVERARRDLATRPRQGGVFAKMLKELESKHVILWRRQGTQSNDKTSQQRRLASSTTTTTTTTTSPRGHGAGLFRVTPRALHETMYPEPKGFFRSESSTQRTAAMARSRTRVYVPRFLVALLKLEDCAATRLYFRRPSLFAFFEDFLVMPNPAYYDDAAFAADPKLAAKATKKGFGLVAWWIHPELRKRSRFFSCHADLRLPSRLSKVSTTQDASADRGFAGIAVADVLDCAFDAVPYLYDVSDLSAEHAPAMRRLSSFVRRHLADVYGVFRDFEAYFHRQHSMWSAPDRAWAMTLHLHVAVARARTPACYCHSIALDDPALCRGGGGANRRRRRRPAGFWSSSDDDDADDGGFSDDDEPSLDFELLNVPDDPDDFDKVASGLRDSGFLVSKPFTPAQLSFDDLLGYSP